MERIDFSLLADSDVDSRYTMGDRATATTTATVTRRPSSGHNERYVAGWKNPPRSATSSASSSSSSYSSSPSSLHAPSGRSASSTLHGPDGRSASPSASSSSSLRAPSGLRPSEEGFLMDCTGSMQSWIDQCHRSISAVIRVVQERFPLLVVAVSPFPLFWSLGRFSRFLGQLRLSLGA